MHGYHARQAALAIPVLTAAGVLGMMAFIARRRLDMVDEGYLLRIIADPDATREVGEVYLFGFVLHPLFEFARRDVAVFRLMGFCVVACGAMVLSREVVVLLGSRGVRTTRSMATAVGLVAAASSMLVFSFNVTIPAYRSVTLVGLTATTVGLIRTYRGRDWSGGCLLGLGIWTTFVGKPPSAVALLLVLVPLLLNFRLLRIRVLIAGAIATAVGIGGTLLVARMSVAGAAQYLSGGAHQAALLGSHSDVASMVGLGVQRLEGLIFFGPGFTAALLVGLTLRRRASMRRQPLVDLTSGLLITGCSGVTAAWAAHTLGPDGYGWQVLSLALLVPLLAGTLMFHLLREGGGGSWVSFPRALVIFLMVLPWVSAVGSNVSFTVGMPLAMVFWFLAVVLLALERDSRLPGIGATPVVLTFVASLVAALTFVVHRDGLAGGDVGRGLTDAPVAGGQLFLPPSDAEAAKAIRAVAAEHAITRDTPVVDLSGVGAGYAFMTGGRPLGRAHMYGYLPNSVAAAEHALSGASCSDRSAAWLIYAPHNAYDISRAFTGDSLSLETDYDVVTVFTAKSVRGTWEMRLLRPRPTVGDALGC